jgi:hypothetical protein
MKSILLKNILYTILFSFIIGILKVEYFLSYLDNDLISNARVMSYITLIIGSVFFYFFIIISLFFSYTIIEFFEMGRGFNVLNFYKSMNYFVYFLFLNEISKLLITIFSFRSNTIYSVQDFNNTIKNNVLWSELLEYSDIIFIIIGSFVYLFYFIKLDTKVKTINVIYSILPLIFSFFIFRYFYN